MSRTVLLILVAGSAIAIASCGDPVHDGEVSALGGETAGVPQGPLHRPGQPCLVCHGGLGPGSPEFAVAGTVFQVPTVRTGMNGVTVKITDANKVVGSATTNAAGNFFILASDYAPAWPFSASLSDGTVTNTMLTHIGRNGSCAVCHFDPAGTASPGHVYLAGDVADLPDGGP